MADISRALMDAAIKAQAENEAAKKAKMQRHLRAAMMSKVPDADRKEFETYLKDPQVGGLDNLSENSINILKHQTDSSDPTRQRQAKLAMQVLDEAQRLYAARIQADYLASQPKPAAPATSAAAPASATVTPSTDPQRFVATLPGHTPEFSRNIQVGSIMPMKGVPQRGLTGPVAPLTTAPAQQQNTGRAATTPVYTLDPTKPAASLPDVPLAGVAKDTTLPNGLTPAPEERPLSLDAPLNLSEKSSKAKPTTQPQQVAQAPAASAAAAPLPKREKERATHEQAKEGAIMLERNAHAQVTAAADKAAAQERTLAEARAKQAEQGKKAAHLDSLRAEEAELRAQAAAKRHAANTAAEDAQKLAKAREIDATNHALFAKADITAQERNARPNVYAALAAREIDARNAAAAKKAADRAHEVKEALAIAPAPTAANTAADTQRLAATKEAAERAAAEAAKAKAETAAREALAIPATKPAPAAGKIIYTPEAGDGWTNVAQADNADMRALRNIVRKELGKKASARDVLNVLGLALAHENGAENIDKLNSATKVRVVSAEELKQDIATLKKTRRIDQDGHINPGALPRELSAIFPEGPGATPAGTQAVVQGPKK